MKKILLYLPIILIVSLTSCKKEDAGKDVNASISKLVYFNETFNELYADGKISTEATGEEKSEYSKLESIGSEYYDLMNKINNQVKKEKEALAEGDEIDNYEEAYKKALKDNEEKINTVTTEFQKNLEILETFAPKE